MKIGLVGKPSVGKSSVFKALTMTEVPIAEFPFTTIEPNIGVGYAKVECACREFGVECNPRHGYCIEGWRFVPVELVDVAGLVPGAHEGKGLGNKFLDDLRQADVLVQLVDATGTTNEKGEKIPPGQYDPSRDIEFLEHELTMWIHGILEKNWDKMSRIEMQRDREEVLYDVLCGLKFGKKQIKKALEDLGLDKPLKNWTPQERERFAERVLRESKPTVIGANKADAAPPENIEKLKQGHPDKTIIPCSAHAEIALKTAAKKGYIKYIPGESSFQVLKHLSPQQEKGLEVIRKKLLEPYGSTGIQDLVDTAVFNILGYIAVFPVASPKLEDKEGNTLPDCYLVPKGTTALDLAYMIHKEIGEGFIKAIDIRTKRALGKEYELKHRDVIEIIARA